MEGRGLTKGLSSLGRRDGRPSFGRLPFGRVNSDPGQERKSSESSRLKGQRKVRRTKTHKLSEKREVSLKRPEGPEMARGFRSQEVTRAFGSKGTNPAVTRGVKDKQIY